MTEGDPTCSAPRTVAVAGAGAAGTLTAARLLQAAADRGVPLEVLLADPAEATGRGIAYATRDERHLLNVPAGRMSALPDVPDDFVRWLERSCGTPVAPDRFVPRRLFGAYLHDHLEGLAARAASTGFGRLVRLRERFTSAVRDARGLTLTTASGRRVTADAVVVATGNLPPGTAWAPPALRAWHGFVPDPWAPGALDRLTGATAADGPTAAATDPTNPADTADATAAADVLLVGTGLTMVDVVLSLDLPARPGLRLHAVSRAGLVPQSHAPGHTPPAPPHDALSALAALTAPASAEADTSTGSGTGTGTGTNTRTDAEADADAVRPGSVGLDELRRAVLRHVARTRRAVGDWRPAVDGLRPLTAALWQSLTEADRARFLREDARVWEVHRHRMPPVTAARLAACLDTGRLTVHAAQVADAVPDGGRLRTVLSDGRTLTVAAVVNCTGPGAGRDAFSEALCAAGLAAPGPLGLGLATTADGRLTCPGNPDGHDGAPLWTLGAPRRGTLWESTAIPEIRAQAARVATAVLDTLAPTAAPTAPPAPRHPHRRTGPADRYGLRLTTTPEAAAAYDEGLGRILRVQDGAVDRIAEAVRVDPDFAVGHAALALLGHEGGTGGTEVNVAAELRAARAAVSRRGDARERSFVAAVAARVGGEGTASGTGPPAPEAGHAALLRHIADHPRDALAVSLAVPTIAFGGVTSGEQTWALVESLAPAYGDDWWYQGQLAFVRQEQERWAEAAELAARSLAAVPSSGHAVHARAHVLYETGRHDEGLAWLDEWLRTEGAAAGQRSHFSWHAALHELMTGRPEAVRRRYLEQLAPPCVTGTRALVDSGALLWRCRMTGVWDDQGARPAEVLGHAPDGWLTDPPTAFAALHTAVCLAAAGDTRGLARLGAYAARHAQPVFRRAVAPLCTALDAVVDGAWERAVRVLRTETLPHLAAVGGSLAQRAVVEETLLFALTAAGRYAEAAALLDARLDRRPGPLDRTRRAALPVVPGGAAGDDSTAGGGG